MPIISTLQPRDDTCATGASCRSEAQAAGDEVEELALLVPFMVLATLWLSAITMGNLLGVIRTVLFILLDAMETLWIRLALRWPGGAVAVLCSSTACYTAVYITWRTAEHGVQYKSGGQHLAWMLW